MGVRPESKSCIEKTSKFGLEKFRISLAHQVQTSESRWMGPSAVAGGVGLIPGGVAVTNNASDQVRVAILFGRSPPPCWLFPCRQVTGHQRSFALPLLLLHNHCRPKIS